MGSKLREIRERMGFSSARSFFSFLQKKALLGFNYPYYMKIEGEQVIPSAKVVNQLAALLPEAYGDELVASYCKILFPGRARLFQSSEPSSVPTPPRPLKKMSSKKTGDPGFHQVELNERQVSVLAADERNYFLFLVVTLARMPLTPEILDKQFRFNEIASATEALISAKLIARDEHGRLSPSYPEFRFPEPSSKSLKQLFVTLDQYDARRTQFFKMAKVKRGQFFRRISPKYLQLLEMNLELLFQMLRLADETDVVNNTHVVALSLSLHEAKLPG